MSKPIKLQLDATLQRVAGQMEELTFHVTGHRKLKSGRHEHYEIELTTCRFAVVKLLREFNDLHTRDRTRIHDLERRLRTELTTFKPAE